MQKKAEDSSGSIYRVRLTNVLELGGVVAVGRSFDARDEDSEPAPFFTGVSGWDPAGEVIRFLSFNRDGLMVEGTIKLSGDHEIRYDYTFAYPGVEGKRAGRDVMHFNQQRTAFTCTFAMQRSPGGEMEQYAVLEMVRKDPTERG